MHIRFPFSHKRDVKRLVDLGDMEDHVEAVSLWRVLMCAALESRAAGRTVIETPHLLLAAARVERRYAAERKTDIEWLRTLALASPAGQPTPQNETRAGHGRLTLSVPARDVIAEARNARDVLETDGL